MSYDMRDYVCPAGRAFVLSSNESCQSVQARDGWVEFRKNGLVEEFRVTDTTIDRGADTSSLWTPDNQYHGKFYVQYAGQDYGCPWIARFMDKGQVYHRVCRVVWYDYQGWQLADDIAESNITLRNWYSNFTLPNGVVVPDVIELLWENIELYYYAKGLGLVGWRNMQDGSFGNYLAGYDAAVQEPVPHPIPRPALLAAGAEPAASAVALYGVRLRAMPGLNGATLRYLTYGERVTVYGKPVVSLDGYDWVRVETASGSGWAARTISGTAAFKPAPGATLTLKMPFKRNTITARFNEPRNYSQIAPTRLQKHEGIDVIDANAAQYGTDPVIHVGAASIVAEVGYDAKGYGNFVRIDLGNHWVVWYGHLAEVYVKQGQALKDGQIIGLMGSTGNSTGPHCHITVQHIGAGLSNYVVADVVDPEPLLVSS